MLIAFDFGISNSDIGTQKNGVCNFYSSISQNTQLTPTVLLSLMQEHQINLQEIECIGVTGGKSSDLPDNIGAIPLVKVNEIDAIGLGAKTLYQINEEATLVVSAGTGTACVLIQGDSFSHLGGIAVGGGMLEGLGSLLFKNSHGQEINEFASQGSRDKLDLLIGDVVNKIGALSPDITAVNFGKAKFASADTMENTSAALCNMIGEVIGTVAYLNALLIGSSEVCFLGRTSHLSEVIKGIDQRLELAGITGHYDDQRAYGNVIGILEQLKNYG
ncbi:pantothenate kinase [Gammaproteobacteria bacterium]|nr:pantothenate kinase [Gammaproteobacteria bacterium]